METAASRTALLLGEEGLARLQNSCVCVLGIGGVGSYCAEALARSGVGHLLLVDGDRIAPSNLNRQIMAVYPTLHQSKTQAMKERIETYRNDIKVDCLDLFYEEAVNEQVFAYPIDFVVDAIDTLSSKRDCIAYCLRHQLPFISSMGMANRLDPTCLEITDLMKTSNDPLAKVMRQLVRKAGLKGRIPVVWSRELPMAQTKIVNEAGKTRKEKMPPASSSFVPAAAGLACASYAVRVLLQKEGKE